MPEFNTGEQKTAVVPMSNPTAKAFDYQSILYMGTDLAIMSQASFHLEAGEQKDISFPVIMPSVPGTYPIHIGVSVAGENIALYKATEDVVIKAVIRVVTVRLRNPPIGATKWQMGVVDWDITAIINWGTTAQDNIGDSAVFDIPAGWKFPLRIVIGIYQKVNGSRQLYRVQSYRPYLWDWDLNDYGTEPDPTYKAIFIPAPGSYRYNVSTEGFEVQP